MMYREFEMSMIGELTFFLGFQVKQLREETFIHQEKYTKDILKKFKMDECKPIKTPMATNGHLDLDVDGIPVDQSLYRSMIGSLLYLTASRSDIIISVCLLSSKPKGITPLGCEKDPSVSQAHPKHRLVVPPRALA